MARYLKATGREALAKLADAHQHLLTPDADVEQHPERYFDRIVEINLSTLEPYVVGPHSPDRARPISQLAKEVAESQGKFVDTISTALIGSCTNSSYEDMSRSADVAEQAKAHGIKAAVPLMVTPGSEKVRATIERDGQMQSLNDIGATVLANACGPCIGQWRRAQEASSAPNTIVTSYNRNFPQRNDGQLTTMNFITSPEITVALALVGKLSFNPLQDPVPGALAQPLSSSLLSQRLTSRSTTLPAARRRILSHRRMAGTLCSRSPQTASGYNSWSPGRPGMVTTFWTCRCW
jgi:aconitate hydratase